MSSWSFCFVCEVTASSSAKSKSLMRTSRTLVFALSLARLNSLPSYLVGSYSPSVALPNACFKIREKKIPKRVGAKTQPCLTPLLMSKGSNMLPSYCDVAFMLSWKDRIKLCSLSGASTFHKDTEEPFPTDQVKHFRKLDEGDVQSLLLFSALFVFVERSARKPHWDRRGRLVAEGALARSTYGVNFILTRTWEAC